LISGGKTGDRMTQNKQIKAGNYYSQVFSLSLLFFCFVFTLSSQTAPQFRVKVKFSCQEGGLENSLITITKGGATYRVIDPSKGKYNVDLDLNAEFTMTFTKPGHITKAIVVDTHVPKDREQSEFAKFEAIVELFKQPEDEIITYSQPVGKISYSFNGGDFDFDHDYTATAQAQIKKDEEHPKPAPKPPTPAPRPVTTPPPPPPPVPPSNPEPVVIKQPEYKPEPEKKKPVPTEPEIIYKPAVKNKEERIIQKDRLKITIVTVTVNDVNYEYKKEEYAWGGVYYYLDGKNITEGTFYRDTE
jgi:hypothetical protein